jgi:hypothetical protein
LLDGSLATKTKTGGGLIPSLIRRFAVRFWRGATKGAGSSLSPASSAMERQNSDISA